MTEVNDAPAHELSAVSEGTADTSDPGANERAGNAGGCDAGDHAESPVHEPPAESTPPSGEVRDTEAVEDRIARLAAVEKTSAWDKDAPVEPEAPRAERPPIHELLAGSGSPAAAVKALKDAGYTSVEVQTFIDSIDEQTFTELLQDGREEPPWLDAFTPDTKLTHAGWECRVITVQPVPDGRHLVLIQPICTTEEARAKFRKDLKRRGFSQKKITAMVREMFPVDDGE